MATAKRRSVLASMNHFKGADQAEDDQRPGLAAVPDVHEQPDGEISPQETQPTDADSEDGGEAPASLEALQLGEEPPTGTLVVEDGIGAFDALTGGEHAEPPAEDQEDELDVPAGAEVEQPDEPEVRQARKPRSRREPNPPPSRRSASVSRQSRREDPIPDPRRRPGWRRADIYLPDPVLRDLRELGRPERCDAERTIGAKFFVQCYVRAVHDIVGDQLDVEELGTFEPEEIEEETIRRVKEALRDLA